MTSVKLNPSLQQIDSQLEDWFISRRFKAERAHTLWSLFKENNFLGIHTPAGVSTNNYHTKLWQDITSGRPYLDSELSSDAKLRKADTYVDIFDQSTNSEHSCRPSGMTFFRCLQKESKSTTKKCDTEFEGFSQCRESILAQSRDAYQTELKKIHDQDLQAKQLFELRKQLLLQA
jgi:hypothetical protein